MDVVVLRGLALPAILLALAWARAAVAGGGPSATLEEGLSFSRDVLPLLSDRCFPCHGPDERARKAGLRLDREESAIEGDAAVIVRHQSSASELYQRIRSTDPGERMPPVGSNLSLSASEVETLRRWIDEGAEWGTHWSFVPPVRPTPPAVDDSGWPRNEIDSFVLARLERAGRKPAREANPELLLRRVTLDLTGLPPTLSELEEFLSDPSEQAYAQVVERLLASPRYGERMAWPWLDAARYADTDGFQADPTRTMWPWRDRLVSALNENQPFDQFTLEALAGDLLPNATAEQIVASGFQRNHMMNGEGGRIAEETRVENVFDRTETMSTVWLGLTATCARCHDHKYDPLSQAEYYGLYAFFDQTSETGAGGGGRAAPTVRHLTAEQLERQRELAQREEELNRALRESSPQTDAEQWQWELATAPEFAAVDAGPTKFGTWSKLGTLAPPGGDPEACFEARYGPEDGVDLAAAFPAGERWRPAPELLDGQTHELPDALGATYLQRVLETPSQRVLDASFGSDDAIRVWLNGVEVLANDARRGVAPDQERVALELKAGSNELLVKIVNTGGRAGVYFRAVEERIGGLPRRLVEVLQRSANERSAEQRAQLADHYRRVVSTRGRASVQELERVRAERERLENEAAIVMVMDELPPAERRTTHVLERGAYDRPLGAVTAGTPAFLPPLEVGSGTVPDRLALARWLVSGENPLTARVAVNRAWQTFFGRGLVATSENFGQQGERPSHPALLDWLAVEFVEGGWDVKALHRRIVMSATYRQTSAVARADYAADPDNVLLARGGRRRLPSWMLRDQALALGGLLVEQLGGPPVRPYQPAGVWAEATFGTIRYEPDEGPALFRRSLYVFWRRIVGPTMFFDAGARQACVVRPSRTNTPLHALTTMNETAFVEAARALAQRALLCEGDARTRIAWVFRLATARTPEEPELERLIARWAALRAEYMEHPEDARALLDVGASPSDPALDPTEHAAMTVICTVLLNLDEVLTRP